MQEILAILTLPMQWLIMKKDAELPWVIRLLRWGAVCLGLLYGALLVVEKAKTVLA